jgi:hypothetical protein
MSSQYYQNIYQARHGYIISDGTGLINQGDYFTTPTIYKKGYNALTIGISIPIARTFYLGVDYYSTSEIGPGVIFNLGFIIH